MVCVYGQCHGIILLDVVVELTEKHPCRSGRLYRKEGEAPLKKVEFAFDCIGSGTVYVTVANARVPADALEEMQSCGH